MARTSPIYYIAPSALTITPNANGSANDLAVYVAKGAKIKVYSPAAGIDMVNATFQEWVFAGKNRRLANNTAPYTIYVRLNLTNREATGYLVFAEKTLEGGEWKDKYAYVTERGVGAIYHSASSDPYAPDNSYIYIRIGDVSLPEAGERTVSYDTGILGTDQYNTEWNMDPDDMPLRVELVCSVDGNETGSTPYVAWGKALLMRAKLVEGWVDTEVDRFDHWTISRSTGDASADLSWPSRQRAEAFAASGNISLQHVRGGDDDFNESVSTVFTVTAWGTPVDGPQGGVEYEELASASIAIMTETVERHDLELSASVVSYDPTTETYTPADGIKVRVRCTDQKGSVYKLTGAQFAAAGIAVQYAVINTDDWLTLDFSGSMPSAVAEAVLPISAFVSQQTVNVRIVRLTDSDSSSSGDEGVETYRVPVAFVRNGEDSREREWIYLRSEGALTFGSDPAGHLLPSLIDYGEVEPTGAAGHVTAVSNQDGWVPEGWWDEMQGTDETYHYEYSAYRDYIHEGDSSSSGESTPGHWGDFCTPRIWSYYAEDGVSYRCRWTLHGTEVWQLTAAYTGAFRGTLPLVATLMRRKGNETEEEVGAAATVIVVGCEGVGYFKTVNALRPQFTVSTEQNAEIITHLNDVNLTGLSVSFTLNGETYEYSIPVIREADEESVKETLEEYGSRMFLSKVHDDTAEGSIEVLGDLTAKTLSATGENEQGLSLQALRDGVIGRLLLVYESIRTKMLQSFNFTGGDSLAGTGWQLTDEDGTGHSRLIVDNLSVRMKATFNELEVRKLTTMGGNYCFSPAASQIEEVDYLDAEGNVLGYEYMKRPWLLRLMPSFLRDNNRMNLLSRRKLVRTKMTDAMWDEVAIYRCWLKADDGSTRTINTWRTGMLARCQTFDTKQMQSATHEGEYATAGQTWTGKNVTTKLYWRAVIATGEQIHKSEYELPAKVLQDNLYHNYIDLSNDHDLCLPGSDRPQAGDQVVCYGDYLNIETSNIITIETVGADAPSIKELVGVGYTDGEHPSWSLDGKMKTRISPTAGNRFVAPEFIVETDGGTPESLYNQHDKGEAKGITTAAAAEATENPNDGDLYLITDVVTANYMLTYDKANDEWVGAQATLGDCYVSLADGHRYMATVTGWQDMGLVSENHSSLKVSIDGIRTEVSSKTSQSEVQSMIDQSAESITQSVTQSVSGQLANYSTIQQTANAITSAVTQEAGRAHVAGRALGIDTAENVEAKEEPTDGDRYLVSDQLNGYMLTYNEDDDEWTGSNATLGDCYVCQSNNHLYCAVTTGWEDRGLYSEAKLQTQISQKANSIDLTTLRNDVETAGIHLDGEHSTIDLVAGKVNFLMPDGTTPAKVSIDTQTGTLHATDGEFEGTIRAKNLYNALCLFGGGNTAADAIYSLRCYYIVRKPVIDPYDPNPTLPFAPEDEDMETASKNFWDALTAGRYYTGEEIDALKEANKVNGVSPLFAETDTEGTLWRPCTGDANIVQLIPATQGYGYTGDDGNTEYPVILPCAKDYPGKVVEITGWTRRQSGEEYFYVGSADNKMKGGLTANAEGRFVFTNETPATLTFWTGGIYLLYSYSTDGQNYYWVNLGSKTL